MREHLFKGFHPSENGKTEITLNGEKIKGQWVYGLPITNHLGIFIVYEENPHYCSQYFYMEIDGLAKVLPETVCEYTGLTDVNGKKIFEGDIGKPANSNTDKVIYAEVCIGEFIDYNSRDLYLGVYLKSDGHKFSAGQLKQYNGKIEVVGNIYENPELLKR